MSGKRYRKILIDGLRYITPDITTIARMKPWEYNLHLDAAKLRETDALYIEAMNSQYTFLQIATDKNGKRIIENTKDLIDVAKIESMIYDPIGYIENAKKEVDDIQQKTNAGKEDAFERLRLVAKKVKEFNEMKGAEE